MMARTLVVVILAVLGASCVRETRVASAPGAPKASTTAWERQVRNAADAGEGDYQFRALRAKMAAEPENIAARLELAKAYRERGYPEVALEIDRLAAERFPASGEARLALARGLRDMNRRQEAVDGLTAFLKANPQDGPEYASWLGILHDEMGAWTLGEPAHRNAVGLAPERDTLHNNLGYNLLMQKKSEDAAAEFREALRLNPGSLVARNNLGLALANSNAVQAVATWQAAADPAAAHNNLAAVWIEKGNYAEARKELRTALGYNRSHPAALKNLELVSRLDGKPAALAATAPESIWQRCKAGLKWLIFGPPESKAAQAPGAPVGTTGEER